MVCFSELYRRYIPMVYGLCLKYLGNKADAEDAVMDLFEDVSQNDKAIRDTAFPYMALQCCQEPLPAAVKERKQGVFCSI